MDPHYRLGLLVSHLSHIEAIELKALHVIGISWHETRIQDLIFSYCMLIGSFAVCFCLF